MPRKRDKVLHLFRRPRTPTLGVRDPSPSPQPGPSAVPSSTHLAVPLTSPLTPSAPVSILERALARLSEDQQALIRARLPSAVEVNDAIGEVYSIAVKCQATVDGSSGDHTFRVKAHQVLRWVDRFKSVGDVAAAADPVHVGLPWAGIRLILEVAVADSRQRRLIIEGMDLALDLANKLRVYAEFLGRVRDGQSKTNLDKELVGMYALVLGFLAQAIRRSERGKLGNVVDALWQGATVEGFEKDSDKLGARTEAATQRCQEEMQRENRDEDKESIRKLMDELGRLREISGLSLALADLLRKLDLSKLSTAKGATYDAYDESQFEKHVAGTRVELLDEIRAWSHDPDGKCIYWLCGKAGTGKSTIARAAASRLQEEGRLGASFFFRRTVADRSHAKMVFPTIAEQLAHKDPGLRQKVAVALQDTPELCEKGLEDQFEQLILRPLQAVTTSQMTPGFFVVIDALDECVNQNDVKRILNLFLTHGGKLGSRLRIFVTSRPELPIERGFVKIDDSVHHDVRLEEIQASTIDRDLRVYFEHRFANLTDDDARAMSYDPLPPSWPGSDRILDLVALVAPLFIAAFTICEFISQSEDPRDSLTAILSHDQPARFSGLTEIYLPILERSLQNKQRGETQTTVLRFQEVVGAIVLLSEPLSAESLSALLNISLRRIQFALQDLHSVLYIPRDTKTPIRAFHLSFREFLIDPGLRDENKYWIDQCNTHNFIAEQCIRLLSGGSLKQDICSVHEPGTRRLQVEDSVVKVALSDPLAYSCRFWMDHLCQADTSGLTDHGRVHRFLREHFLHWIEAMAWLGRLSDSILQLAALERLLQDNRKCRELRGFLLDAHRFVLRFRYIIDEAPLQLYLSALIYAPVASIIKEIFKTSVLPTCICASPALEPDWGPFGLKIPHRFNPLAIALSPDGRRVASYTLPDNVSEVWDIATGSMIDRQRCPSWVVQEEVESLEIVFTPRGHVFAAVCHIHGVAKITNRGYNRMDSTITVWDTSSDDRLCSFNLTRVHGLESRVRGSALGKFSSDGRMFAASPEPSQIRTWATASLEESHRLVLHGNNTIDTLALSNTGLFLAAITSDRNTRLWNTETWQELGRFDIPEQSLPGSCSHLAVSSSAERVAMRFRTEQDYMDMATNSYVDTADAVWSRSSNSIQRISTTRQPLERSGTALHFLSSSEDVLAAAGNDSVRIFGLAPGTDEHRSPSTRMLETQYHSLFTLSCTGGVMACIDREGCVAVWTYTSDCGQGETAKHEKMTFYQTARVSADGDYVVADSSDDSTAVIDTLTGTKMEFVNSQDSSPHFQGQFQARLDSQDLVVCRSEERDAIHAYSNVKHFAFSPGNAFMLVIYVSLEVAILDLERGYERLKASLVGYTIPEHLDHVTLSSDGETIAMAYQEDIHCLNLRTKRLRSIESYPRSGALPSHCSLGFSVDGRRLVYCVPSYQAYVVRLEDWTGRAYVMNFWRREVCFQGDRVATINGHSIELWNRLSGIKEQILCGHSNFPITMAFSAAGDTLVSAGYDLSIRLWNTKTGKELHAWHDLPCPVHSISISANGGTVAAIMADHRVHIWNRRTNVTQNIVQRYRERMHDLIAMSHDGQLVATMATMATMATKNALTILGTAKGEIVKSIPGKPTWIGWLEFVDGDDSVESRLGRLQIKRDLSAGYGTWDPPEIDFYGGWVRHRGRDVLYVPSTHQPPPFNWDCRGRVTAIAQSMGGLGIYRLLSP